MSKRARGRPRTANADRVRELMRLHHCSRQWAYKLLKRERNGQFIEPNVQMKSYYEKAS